MNARLVINVAKYVGAVAIGVTVGAVTRPAVKEFFKLNKKEAVETIPSEDLAKEEIRDEE